MEGREGGLDRYVPMCCFQGRSRSRLKNSDRGRVVLARLVSKTSWGRIDVDVARQFSRQLFAEIYLCRSVITRCGCCCRYGFGGEKVVDEIEEVPKEGAASRLGLASFSAANSMRTRRGGGGRV